MLYRSVALSLAALCAKEAAGLQPKHAVHLEPEEEPSQDTPGETGAEPDEETEVTEDGLKLLATGKDEPTGEDTPQEETGTPPDEEKFDPEHPLVLAAMAGSGTCAHLTSTGVAGLLECIDKDGSGNPIRCGPHTGHPDEWSCCQNYGGRAKCTGDYPVMCNDPNGANGDYACWQTAAQCQQYDQCQDGVCVRPCDEAGENGVTGETDTTTSTTTTTPIEVGNEGEIAGGGEETAETGEGEETTVIAGGEEFTDYCGGNGWIHCSGYIAMGGNVRYPFRTNMENAKKICNDNPTCGGITTNKGDAAEGYFWWKTKTHNLRCWHHGSWDTCWPPNTPLNIVKTAPYCGAGGWKHCKGFLKAGGDVDFPGVDDDFGDIQMTMQQAKQKCQSESSCGAIHTDKLWAASGGFWFKTKSHDLRCSVDNKGTWNMCWPPGTASNVMTAHANPNSAITVSVTPSPYYCEGKEWVHCPGYMPMGGNVPTFPRRMSMAEAKAKCMEEPTCMGITTNKRAAAEGTFWLKNSNNPRCYGTHLGTWNTCWKPGAVSHGILASNKFCGAGRWKHCKGFMQAGGNIVNGQDVRMTMEEAKLACKADSACKGITTNKKYAPEGRFWLKKASQLNGAGSCYPNGNWDTCIAL